MYLPKMNQVDDPAAHLPFVVEEEGERIARELEAGSDSVAAETARLMRMHNRMEAE